MYIDVAQIKPVEVLKEVALYTDRVGRSLTINRTTGDYYVSQVYNQSRGDIYITRLNSYGIILSYMVLRGFGHGTSIDIENVDGQVYLWVEADGQEDSDGKKYGRKIARVKYVDNSEVVSSEADLYDVLPGRTNLSVAIDQKNDLIAIRSRSGSVVYYNVFKLSNVKKRIFTKEYEFVSPVDGTRGHSICEDHIYLWEGTGITGTETTPDNTIYCFTLTGETVYSRKLDLGNKLYYKEPEGIKVFFDGNKFDMYLGLATGSPGERRYTVYRYTKTIPQPGGGSTTLRKKVTVTNVNDGKPGKPGVNGESLYTWVMYADDAQGGGISPFPAGKKYIGIAENKNTPNPSLDPKMYKWSLIKGEDGEVFYTWIKYADNDQGAGMSESPEGKTYMGIAINKPVPQESNDPRDYTWSKIRGEDGKDGTSVNIKGEKPSVDALPSGALEGDGWLVKGDLYVWNGREWINVGRIQGPVGPQGVPGLNGSDGKTLYTWIRYADDAHGNGISNIPDGKEYIGLAHNKETFVESNNPADYVWSKFKGENGTDGTNGIDGRPGADGKTYYTWIKYSNNPDGSGLNDDPNSKYIGIGYNKPSPVESNNPADYSWTLIRGADGKPGTDGVDGIDGRPGADGKTYYTWIKYSDYADGRNMDDNPNRRYIGIAYNKESRVEGTDPREYSWSLIKGNDGAQGVPGQPGADSYSCSVKSSHGNVFKNGAGESTLKVTVFKGGTEFDPNGGSASYNWKKASNGSQDNWSANGKSIVVNQNHVDGVTVFTCEVSVGGKVVTIGECTITDMADTVVSATPPANPIKGQLWKDTNTGELKMWDGSKWVKAVPEQIIGANNKLLNATYRKPIEKPHVTIDGNFLSPGGYKTLMVERTGLTSDAWTGYEHRVDMKATKTLSAQVKVYIPSNVPEVNGVVLEVLEYTSGGTRLRTLGWKSADVNLRDTWQQLKIENMKLTNQDTGIIAVYYWVQKNGKCWFAEPQLEIGSTCSDFREAIEDLQEQADDALNKLLFIEQKIENGAIVETVMGSEEFNYILNGKADIADIDGMATQEDVNNMKDQLQGYIDSQIGGIDMSAFISKTEFQQTMKDFKFQFTQGGGVNLIMDSIGFATDHSAWSHISSGIRPIQNSYIEGLGFTSGWYFGSGGKDMRQKILLTPNKPYTVSGFIKKTAHNPGGDARFGFWFSDGGYAIDQKPIIKFLFDENRTYNYDYFYFTFTPSTNSVWFNPWGGQNSNEVILTGLMLNQGSLPFGWQSHPQEIYNSNVKLDMNGITVYRGETNGGKPTGYTRMSPKEFAGYYDTDGDGVYEEVFALKEDYTVAKKIIARDEINLGNLKMVKIKSNTFNGVAFVPLDASAQVSSVLDGEQ